MNILVLGAKGFIGTHLVDILNKYGHNVVDLDIDELDIQEDIGTLRYVLSHDKIEIVYHLAVAPLNLCRECYERCIKTNVIGTAHLMKAISETDTVKRIIYTSASSVYGNTLKSPTSEDVLPTPVTLYGATKLSAEHIIKAATEEINNTRYDFNHIIFRLSNVYGPGQVAGIIPTVIQSIVAKCPIEITGDGTQTRDFVYVSDVVNLLVEAMMNPIYSSTMNIGSGKSVSINDIVRKVSARLDYYPDPKISYIPEQVDRSQYIADITLLRTVYPLFNPTDFDIGILKTIQSYLDEV